METKTLEKTPRFARTKIAKVLAGAVLAASIFTSERARADDNLQTGAIVLGGARLSTTPGVTFDPLSTTLHYSGLSYSFGDSDFTQQYDGKQVKVIDYFEHLKFDDLSKLGDLLNFGKSLRENLGVYGPGSYHLALGGSIEAFGEGYLRGSGNGDYGPYATELGGSAYFYAKGQAYLNLNLKYDNWDLPTYFNSNMNAGFSAQMRSFYGLGLESQLQGNEINLGYGIGGRKFVNFDGAGSLTSVANGGLFSGFSANAQSDIWQKNSRGYEILPYLTLSTNHEIKLKLNAGLNIRSEDDSYSYDHHNVQVGLGTDPITQSSNIQTNTSSLIVTPVISGVIAPKDGGDILPVLSFSTREGFLARGALGIHTDRLYASGTISTALDASSEMLVLVSGSLSSSEFASYLFENEAAEVGFLPSFRSRMLRNRQALITSSDKFMIRSALNYNRLFSELSSENGIVYSRNNFFIENGLRLFNGENIGGGLYNSIGTKKFFTTQSYSTSFGASGPKVQTLQVSIGGFLP